MLNTTLLRPRTATGEDREFLWLLHRETMRDYVDQAWGWNDDRQREHFDESFDSARLQTIEYRGHAIGYISVERAGDEIFLAGMEMATLGVPNGQICQIGRSHRSAARSAWAGNRALSPFPREIGRRSYGHPGR